MSEGDGEHDVLSHLPRSRPTRRSAKRDSGRGPAKAATTSQAKPKAAAKPKPAARPKAAAKPKTAAKPRAKASAKPGPAVKPGPKPIGADVPAAGWAAPPERSTPDSNTVDLVGVARQAAEGVLGTVGKLLGRLPRP